MDGTSEVEPSAASGTTASSPPGGAALPPPAPAPTAPAPTAKGASPGLCSDGRRALIATVAAFALPLSLAVLIPLLTPSLQQGSATSLVLLLIGWNTFVVVYGGLTAHVFARVDATTFRARMAARTGHRARAWKRLTPFGDGPSYAVESAIVAFAVVLVLPHIDAIQIDDWVLVPVTLTILLSSWTLSVISYALHYAQNDLAEPGLDFPGERTNAFADYLYFAIAVATTFGATDVNITTPRMRKVVNLHTILTFVYNSVIVALLASLLIKS